MDLPKSRTLMDIVRETDQLVSLVAENGGEITSELEFELTKNKYTLSDKLDSYGHVIEAFKQRQEYAIHRMKEWEKMASLCERSIENLQERVLAALTALESPEVHGMEFSFKVALNPPSVNIVDEAKIPGEYIVTETKTTIKPDRRKILDAVKDGKSIDGIEVVRNRRLVIKTSQRKEIKGGT